MAREIKFLVTIVSLISENLISNSSLKKAVFILTEGFKYLYSSSSDSSMDFSTIFCCFSERYSPLGGSIVAY